MRTRTLTEEVLVAGEGVVTVGWRILEDLKRQAQGNSRQRIRLCAHREVTDLLHEMFIVHANGAYIRPHKHLNKSESYHLIEGAVDCVIFDDAGQVTNAIRLEAYPARGVFFCRVPEAWYHTLLIRSPVAVFHETTKGPFNKTETSFAAWAPDETDPRTVRAFLQRVSEDAERLLGGRTREGDGA